MPQEASLPSTVVMAMPCRTAVSYSSALKPNAPSPEITIALRSGCASFAAIAVEMAVPSIPRPEKYDHVRGVLAGRYARPQWQKSPPSKTTKSSSSIKESSVL